MQGQGQNNALGLSDKPNVQNIVDTGYGSLAEWMNGQYRPINQAVSDYRAATYPGLYLDIVPTSQKFINDIVPK